MRTGNPVLNEKTFIETALDNEDVMTMNGVCGKGIVLLVLLFTGAFLIWSKAMPELQESARVIQQEGHIAQTYNAPSWLIRWTIGGCLAGFVLALVIIFNPRLSGYLSPFYAFLEGVVLGGISALFEVAYPGIALQAMACTFGVFGTMLFIYWARIIQASRKLQIGLTAAVGGIVLYYLVSLVVGMFGGSPLPLIHETGWAGIGFSIFVVVVASLCLILDFDLIERGIQNRSPKYLEWYGVFSLLVTLVWLYLEILRLLAKVRSK